MSTEQFSPYVGLRPFRAEENLLFFGRDTQTLELLQRLHEHRFVAVVGGSGSGKSSLIRAGLIPALKGGYLVEDSRNWVVYSMKPGQNAMFNLAKSILSQMNSEVTPSEINSLVKQIKREGVAAITSKLETLKKEKGANFFLLVDQFEELFRFASEQHNISKKTDAIDFVNTILNLSKQQTIPFYVVLTMRSDFIGDCAQFRDLPEAMNKSQYLVPRLTRQQLKTVIEGPSKLYGKKFDTTLTSHLINDLEKVKDELPLVQHALMRMWNHEVNVHKNGIIDFEDYKAVGGIENALSHHAEEAIKDMNSADLSIAKELFQALTAVDENGRKIRRPLLLSDLRALTGANEEHLLHIINLFIEDQRSFLIVETTSSGQDKVIDISHESLIRQWNTLRHWVDEEAESASFYLQLSEAYRLHKSGKKDHLTGSELQLALDWREKFKPSAVWANRYKPDYEESMTYLEASNQEFIRLQNIEKSRRKKQRILVFTIMALVGLFAAYAMLERNKAQSRELEANNKKNAFQLHFHATVVDSKDPTTALRLEQEALRLYDYPAFRKLGMEIANNHPLYRINLQDSLGVTAIDVSENGKYRILGNDRGYIRIWDDKGLLIKSIKAHDKEITSLKFLPDNSGFVSSSLDLTLAVWNNQGENITKTKPFSNPIQKIVFSPQGQLVTANRIGEVSFWNSEWNIEWSFRPHEKRVSAIAFSEVKPQLLTGSADNTARLWDLEGNMIREFKEHRGEVYAVAFSPDGGSVLTGSWDSNARMWKLDGSSEMVEFKGHWGAILNVAFSPDGLQILTGSFDSTMRLWDLKGKLLDDFFGHKSEVKLASFSKDGKTIHSGSRDGSMRAWFRADIKEAVIDENNVNRSVRFAPDGKTFLSGTQNKAQLWGLKGNLKHNFSCQGSRMVFTAIYSPDGLHMATGSQDGSVRLWNLNERKMDWEDNKVKDPTRADVRAIAFAPDGKTFVTGTWDYMIRLWNLDGTVKDSLQHDKGITSVAFSPDGKSIIAGTFGKSLLWNIEQKKVVEIKEPSLLYVNGVAFTPNGDQVLTGSNDNGARLWDLDGKLIREFKGPRGAVRSVAISNNGKYILTGTNGGTARLWDFDANILAEYQYDKGSVFTVAFSPDDQSFLMGSGDMIYHIKIVDLDQFLEESPIQPLGSEQKKEFKLTD